METHRVGPRGEGSGWFVVSPYSMWLQVTVEIRTFDKNQEKKNELPPEHPPSTWDAKNKKRLRSALLRPRVAIPGSCGDSPDVCARDGGE